MASENIPTIPLELNLVIDRVSINKKNRPVKPLYRINVGFVTE